MENFSNTTDFVKHVNSLRKQNKGKWVFFLCRVENKEVRLKFIDTWLQIYIVDDHNKHLGVMEQSVKEFTRLLENGVK